MTRRVFGGPAVIAAMTLAGLLLALTGDGWRDAVSWVALAIPVVAVVRAWRKRR